MKSTSISLSSVAGAPWARGITVELDGSCDIGSVDLTDSMGDCIIIYGSEDMRALAKFLNEAADAIDAKEVGLV